MQNLTLTDAEYHRFLMTVSEFAKHHNLQLDGWTVGHSRTIYEGSPADIDAFCVDMQTRGAYADRYDDKTVRV